MNHTYRYLDTVVSYTMTDVIRDHVWLFLGTLSMLLVLIIIYFARREKMQIEAARHEQEQEQNKLLEEALSAANQASVAKKVFLQNPLTPDSIL